jgi:hypothetical protein
MGYDAARKRLEAITANPAILNFFEDLAKSGDFDDAFKSAAAIADHDALRHRTSQRGTRCMPLSEIPEWGQRYLKPSLAGDVDAASSLAVACHDFQRGALAYTFWRKGASPDVVRVLVDMALTQTHEFRAITHLRELLHFAAFPLPDLPERVTVYRGGDADGLSWTLDRRVAERFANQNGGEVHERTIERKSILFFSNEREEREIIFDDALT